MRDRKVYLQGTHRVVAPEQTLERVRPWLAEMGITRIANITGLDRVGIPTVLVCRPNSRSIAVAQGKGVDLPAAKVSGVMEAIEVFHAETILLPVRYASHADLLREHRVAAIDGVPQDRLGELPADTRILWIEGRDLADGCASWLPLEVVSTDYTLPQPPGSGYFKATTNGLASGNTLEEACLHAVCELIERDAAALWHLGGAEARGRTRLDLGTVDDPTALELLERFARARVQIGVWETTADVGVASFVALAASLCDDADPEIGAGCHPARGVALCRALTEAAQARVGFISGARDDLLPDLYAPAARRRRAERARAWLADPVSARRFGDAPELASDTPAADLDRVLGRLTAVGFDEAVVVDLTKPAFGLPVVRAVVPGLEGPFDKDAGWQPSRRAHAAFERRQ